MAEQKECLRCEKNATIACFGCKKYYCENCFNLMHEKDKLKIHKKEEISRFLSIEFDCLKHEGYQITSFCLADKGKSIF